MIFSHLPYSRYPAEIAESITEIENELVELEAVSSLDRARALIKCLDMIRADKVRVAL